MSIAADLSDESDEEDEDRDQVEIIASVTSAKMKVDNLQEDHQGNEKPDLSLNKKKDKYKDFTLCDDCIASLIRKCWSQNPNERPNFFEICSLL